MKSCPDANALARLLDGEPSREIEHHLDDCSACSELLGELAWIVAPGRPLPPGFRVVRSLGLGRWLALRDDRLVALELGPLAPAELPAHADLVPLLEHGSFGNEQFVATPHVEPGFRALVWRAMLDALVRVHAAGIAIGPTPDRVGVAGDAIKFLPRTTRRELRYLAPEVLRGGPITVRSDQFAACAMLWEALAGRPPYRGATAGALVVSAMSRPILPKGDRHIFGVLARGLAADPSARWPDLAALRDALDRRSFFTRVRDLFGRPPLSRV